MAIPDGVETVTITSGAPITLPDGTLVRGHIRFIAPDLNLIDDENYIFGGESTAELCHGEFSITLVPPDATGITPTGWTYTAIAEFTNADGWTRYVDITKDNPNVFLDDVLVLTPGDVTYPDTTFVRKVGDTMLGPLILAADPVVALGAATKQYVDNAFDPDQFVDVAGDTMTGELVLFGDPTQALGASPKQYTDAQAAAAQVAAAAESVSLAGDTMTGQLVLFGNPTVALGAAPRQYVDAGDAATLAAAAAESVSLSGDTMTGPLVLNADPSVALGASTKQYTDAQAAAAQAAAASESVSISGDTMTGPLVLNADPSVALGAATKQYVDQAESDAVTAATAAAAAESVSLSGDTMTGPLILSGDPATALGAATKQYAEAVADAAQAAAEATASAESVSLAGDTMSGELVLFGDPTVALGAAPKQYVDAAQAAAEAAAAAESVSISGDTMTGTLNATLATDATVAVASKLAADTKNKFQRLSDGTHEWGDGTNDPDTNLRRMSANVLGTDDTFQIGAAGALLLGASGDVNLYRLGPDSMATDDDFSVFGAMTLSGDPTTANQAANKSYVDSGDAANASDIADVAADLATLDGEVVKLTGDQTVNGIKTFGSIPVLPASDPTTANQATRKSYVDTLDAQNVKLTGNQTVNGVKTFGSIPVLPGSDPVAANEATRKSYVDTLDAQNVKITGNQNVSGIKTFANTVQMNNAVNGVAAATLVDVDVFDSWQMSHRGRMGWGTGAATRDAFFERIDVGVLQATSQIRVTGSAPSNAADLTRKDYVDGLDAQNVKLTGNQTIAGVKTFSSIPVGPASDPTTANELTRKSYVDTLDAQNVKLTGNQTIAGVKTFSSIPVLPASDPTLSEQATRKTYVDNTIVSEIFTRTGLSTGIITGGELNVNADPTKVDVGATTGVVLDYVTTPMTPTLTKVSYAGATGVTITNLSAPVTWFLLTSAGSLIQQTTRPTNVQRRTHLVIGGVLVVSGAAVEDQSLPNYIPQSNNQLYDLMDALGPFNITGNVLSAASTDLTVAKTAGTVFSRDFNHFSGATLTNDPHVSSTPSQNPMQWRYATQVSTTPAALVTSIDPTMYDNAGTITAVGGGANSSTIQRVFITPLNATANQVAIQYGQTVYANLDAAIAAVGSAQYVKNPNLADAVLIGYIVTTRTCTNLADAANARIIIASRLSGNPSGTGDALSLAVLKSGDTMTGPLILSGDPTNVLGAATKQYVDGLDTANVKLTGNQTVAGIKTFSSIPVGPASDPTTGNQLTRKTYVDNLDAANVKLTGDQSVAGIKTFSSIPVGPASDPTTGNQLTRKTYVDNLDAANVKLTGDQSVAGIKTFSSIPVLPASDPTTANQATRKSYVDTLDGANVKLTGNQSVAGVKTFSSGIVLSTGVGRIVSAVKSGATSRNTTTTPTADPHLVVAVEANSRYDVTCIIGWTNGGGGMRVNFTAPASSAMLWVDNDGSVAATLASADLTFNVTLGTTLKGTLITAGTAGNLTLVWAQNSSNASNTTLLTGCGLHIERVA